MYKETHTVIYASLDGHIGSILVESSCQGAADITLNLVSNVIDIRFGSHTCSSQETSMNQGVLPG